MSVGATRKVSSSLPGKSAERSYSVANSGAPFVEHVDTTNNVAVYDGLKDDSSQNFQQNQKENEEQQEHKFSPSSAYVASAIEALVASGVFDYPEDKEKYNTHSRKIGVYDSNQSIIKDEETDKIGHQYLKHFYEKNEVLEDVDELV